MKTKYRTGIFTARGFVWPLKTLDPDYLARKRFSKMPEGWNDFAYACAGIEFRHGFHLGHPYCLSLCLRR